MFTFKVANIQLPLNLTSLLVYKGEMKSELVRQLIPSHLPGFTQVFNKWNS